MPEMEQSQKTVVKESSSKVTGDSGQDKHVTVRVHRTLASFIISKKLWMTVFAVLVMWFAYWNQVNFLYSFTTPEQIVAFSGLTRDFMFALTAIVSSYLGIEGLVSWKHGTETIVNQATSFIRDKKEETKNETTTENKNVKIDLTEDLKQHIKEEGINAPELKPFGAQALGDEEHGEYGDF